MRLLLVQSTVYYQKLVLTIKVRQCGRVLGFWSMFKFHVYLVESQNVCDHIVLNAVQRMLATYMLSLHNSNQEVRITSSSCRPQQIEYSGLYWPIPREQRLHFGCVSCRAKSSLCRQPFKSVQKSGRINLKNSFFLFLTGLEHCASLAWVLRSISELT